MYKLTLYKFCIIAFMVMPMLILVTAACSNVNTAKTTDSSTLRSNAPVVLVPVADGTVVYGNGLAEIDASHTDEGYVMIRYDGPVDNVKLQITDPVGIVYTYNLADGYETFPLTGGSGSYSMVIYENVSGDQYATAFSQLLEATIVNEYGPYLYPNQYVYFESGSNTVAKGSDLAQNTSSDLDVVVNVYNYVTKNIKYDKEKAQTVKSGYLPVVDEILDSGKGICFDYAAVMAVMLRSQGIPTRLEVGYAGTAYHAWVSVHLDDRGWVNGVIEFDGSQWKLMDPTFAASNSENAMKDFIGDGTNYQTKLIY